MNLKNRIDLRDSAIESDSKMGFTSQKGWKTTLGVVFHKNKIKINFLNSINFRL